MIAKAHSVNRCGYNVGQAARKVPLPAVMIDVGANVGQSLLGYASLGWQVLAFEPMPLNAVVVRVNVEDNGFGSQVHLFEGAASNHSGQTTIYAPSNGRLDNAALSAKASVASFRGAAIEATRIRLVTLSEALQAAAPRGVRAEDVRFIKVDTQGHEIEGLRAVLPRLHQEVRMKLEYDAALQAAQGHGPLDLADLARRMGFSVYCKGH